MTAANGKAHVLVVEDNPADVELLRYALGGAGVDCELTVIDNGGDALAFFEQRGVYANSTPPDLAILDLNLPRYDGIEILEAMRASRKFADVAVAVLSSSSSPRERARIEAFHIARYITKPPNLDEYMRIGFVVKEMLGEKLAS
ncbi:MAG TPA: response regulator [Bryobacteraceae bacterium]|jgi:CheY-like chemotaxis protein|nr:response regulator [Bryobacteraceae bacterium]